MAVGFPWPESAKGKMVGASRFERPARPPHISAAWQKSLLTRRDATLLLPAVGRPIILLLRTRYSELFWSGRADLNGRPPAPKAGALTRLRYAPTY